MSAYKRSDWNDLIDQVNDVLQNPPGGCDPVAPIDHVEPSHRWAKSDIREVQDAIKETCPDISFDGIPDLWKQSIIDEINDKLGETWCDCGECVTCEYGSTFTDVFIMNAVCDYNCTPGDPGSGKMNWAPRINGMALGVDGFTGRTWQVFRCNPGNNEKAFSTPFGTGTGGVILCDGTAVALQNTSGGAGMTIGRPDGAPFQLWVRLRCNVFCSPEIPVGMRSCESDEGEEEGGGGGPG